MRIFSAIIFIPSDVACRSQYYKVIYQLINSKTVKSDFDLKKSIGTLAIDKIAQMTTIQ